MSFDAVTPLQHISMTAVCCISAVYGTCIIVHNVVNVAKGSDNIQMTSLTKFAFYKTAFSTLLTIWLYTSLRVLTYFALDYSTLPCQFILGGVLIAYSLSKNALYGFFIHRLADTLQATTIAYPPALLKLLCCVNLTLELATIAVAAYQCTNIEPSIFTQLSDTVNACGLKPGWIGYLLLLCFILLDIFWMTFTNYLLIRKLLHLVQESVRVNVSRSTAQLFASSPRLTPKHVQEYHRASQHDNSLILVSSKLAILNTVAAIGSLFMVPLFTMTSAALQYDVIINATVLWLNFKFTETWFRRFQCQRFIACVFPIFKTCAVSDGTGSICCYCCCSHPDAAQTAIDSTSPPQTPTNHDQVAAKDGSRFPYDATNDNDAEQTTTMEQHTASSQKHCCSCCCSPKTQNLYHLAREEYHLYIKEEKKDAF